MIEIYLPKSEASCCFSDGNSVSACKSSVRLSLYTRLGCHIFARIRRAEEGHFWPTHSQIEMPAGAGFASDLSPCCLIGQVVHRDHFLDDPTGVTITTGPVGSHSKGGAMKSSLDTGPLTKEQCLPRHATPRRPRGQLARRMRTILCSKNIPTCPDFSLLYLLD